MAASVAITAEPLVGPRCLFLVGRPVHPDRWAYVADKDAAAGSPLAERLFAIEGVEAVLIAHDLVIVTRAGGDDLPLIGAYVRRLRRVLGRKDVRPVVDWKVLGKQVGAAIRGHLASGAPAVAESLQLAMPSAWELRGRVQVVLDEQVNPVVAGHGGGVEILDVKDNVVYLQMSGGCQGCGLADVTLRQGVEAAVREAVPEIGRIFDLTNHSAGRAPFFKARRGASSPFDIIK